LLDVRHRANISAWKAGGMSRHSVSNAVTMPLGVAFHIVVH